MTRRAVLLAGAALLALAPATASVPGGGPRLEEFRIDDRGTVTQPAPPAPTPAPEPTPAPGPPPEAAEAPLTPAPRAAPPRPRPAEPTTIAPAPEPPVVDAVPPPSPVVAPATPQVELPAPQPTAAPPIPVTPPAAAPEPDDGPVWPWLLIPVALLGLGALAWARRKPAAEPSDSIDLAHPQPAEASLLAALAAPVPRPRIELALEPEAATLQDGALEVRFVLNIVNTGDAAAEDIRVASKLLSGGQEVEDALAGFYADPLANAVRLPQPVPAGASFGLRGRVRSKGEELRALQVRDRTLLVPLVAVNLRYRWGGEEGQTAQSFVLGRELNPPAERMAALPVAASPRVYRGLGTRPHALAKVA